MHANTPHDQDLEPGSGAVLRTLLLTDLVDSTRLVEELGDRRAFEVFGRHDELARGLLPVYEGREIDKTDGFLMLFERPVDAVRYAIAYHHGLDELGRELGLDLAARAGIHLGEVYTRENPPEKVAQGAKPLEVEGLAKPAAARIMSLACGRQTLLTRGAFDLSRRAAMDTELADRHLGWLDHGLYTFKGMDEPVRVFEVGVEGFAPLCAPADSAKVKRVSEVRPETTPKPAPAIAQPLGRVQAGTQLGRYLIVDRVGAGGMGEVFRATDNELDRQVAVKVLPPEHAGDPDRNKRFRREARAVARLSHPNILEIFDIGHEGDTPYVVTELLDGQDLRDTIGGRALPWPRVVELVLPVARALAAAHGGGVVHRDLKPENIFCTGDGRVKVLDFGLARLLQPTQTHSPTESLDRPTTRAGAIIGTAGYLSPEQLRGEAVDGRADLFAFGCLLYEMLSGTRPFTGASAAEVMACTLKEEPEEVEVHCPEAPKALGELVAHCLAKDRDQRLASADEAVHILEALASSATPDRAFASSGRRWTTMTALMLAALLTVVFISWWWQTRNTGPEPSAEAEQTPDRVVVAIFDNQTGDPTLDSLGVMCANEVSLGLSQAGISQVVPGSVAYQTSAELRQAATGSATLDPIIALAEATDARLVISGSILQVGDELQLRAQITNVETGSVAQTLEPAVGKRSDPAAVVDELRQRLAGVLAMHYDMKIDPSLMSEPPSIEAYKSFNRGVLALGGDHETCIREFERAIELAPGFVEAYVWLTVTYNNQGQSARGEEILNRLEATRPRLTEFESNQIRWLRAAQQGRPYEELEAARLLHELAPRAGQPRYVHAYSALRANRPRETLEATADYELSSSMRVVASGHWLSWLVMTAHHLLGQYEEELAHSLAAQEVYPDVISVRRGEVRALVALDRVAEVDQVVEESLSIASHRGYATYTGTPGALMVHAALALRRHGHPTEASAMAERAADWFDKHPQTGSYPAETASLRAGHVLARILCGRLDQAEELAASIASELPAELLIADAVIQGHRGVIAALAGELESTRAFDNRLAAMDSRFLNGDNIYQRARINAVLGETETAIELLRDAFAAGREHGIEVHMDPALESLRELPAYRTLVTPKE